MTRTINALASEATELRVQPRELGPRLKAFILTHGHEDHLGALPYILPEHDVPVFATGFTGALLKRTLEDSTSRGRAD